MSETATSVRSSGLGSRGTQPRVVVGVDGSAASDVVLAVAGRYAASLGATLHVVLAWSRVTAGPVKTISTNSDARAEEEAACRRLDRVLCRVGASRLAVRREVVHGGAATSLLMAAGGADLLVIGVPRRRTGMMLGLTAQDVAVHATCPVLLVPLTD